MISRSEFYSFYCCWVARYAPLDLGFSTLAVDTDGRGTGHTFHLTPEIVERALLVEHAPSGIWAGHEAR